MQKEEIEDFIKKSEKENELLYKETQRMQKELKEYKNPRLHYIFTLTLAEGSFLDLSSVEGWKKFIELHIDIFHKNFACKITQCGSINNTEQFILKEVDNTFNQQMHRCSFEEVEFEVFTNGRDFEVILDPFDKTLDLQFSQNDFYKLNEFFKRWAGKILLESLSLDKYIDESYKNFVEKSLTDKSIYDMILDLDFYSFVIYTYPENIEITNLIEKRFYYPTKKISQNMWVNNGACIRDDHNAPFHMCFVHLKGQLPVEYPSDTLGFLRLLHHHMNFWSMVYITENFMGIITSLPDLISMDGIKIRKVEILEGLFFGKKRGNIKLESLKNMRRSIHDFMYLGLKSDHRGLENDASEQYTPRYIAGKYLNHFQEPEINSTKELLANVTEEKVNKLNEEFKKTWIDLQKRIEDFINATRDLEREYYQEYQLKLVEKTQELTLFSIIIALSIFLIGKIPFDQITQKFLSLLEYLFRSVTFFFQHLI